MKKGFTLIEVLVGVFVFSLVFLSVFGMINLIIRSSSDVQNKINANAIIQGELEKAKNLSYEDIGIIDGYPSGVFEPIKTEVISNKEYVVEIKVEYIVDPQDGVADPEDECPNDYKKMDVKVSWSKPYGGSAVVATNIVPGNLAQECLEEGGVLSVNVFDAFGEMIANPLIEIINPDTLEVVKTATPDSGHHYFSVPVGSYRVVASKNGYSTERTYSIEEVATPNRPNPSISNGKALEINLPIDKLSQASIDTLYPWIISDFFDSFLDENKLSDYSDVIISDGKISLESTEGAYAFLGYAVSDAVEPVSLIEWNQLLWEDENPEDTDIKYQIMYSSNEEDWDLIPEEHLEGNSSGFTDSPVDLSGLDSGMFFNIKLRANLTTSSQSATPFLDEWILEWKSAGGTPVKNVSVNMRGEKKIGTDSEEETIYKYDEIHNSGSLGAINLNNIEWDSYFFSIETDGLELESIIPPDQPIGVEPDSSQSITLFVESQDSSLITVKNDETLEPVFSASVRIIKGEYDNTLYTDANGQVHFIPLEIGEYSIEVEAAGYESNTDSVYVSGSKTFIIQLNQVE